LCASSRTQQAFSGTTLSTMTRRRRRVTSDCGTRALRAT
jgi:hypothetical protein